MIYPWPTITGPNSKNNVQGISKRAVTTWQRVGIAIRLGCVLLRPKCSEAACSRSTPSRPGRQTLLFMFNPSRSQQESGFGNPSSLRPPPGRPFIYTPPSTPFPSAPQPPFGNNGYDIRTHGPTLAIPEAPQTFHPELGSQYEFQYSQCTGKRKVLQVSGVI